MIGLLLVATAMSTEAEIGASARYSSMLDNLIGLAVVTGRPTMVPAGAEFHVVACETLCLGGTVEIFPFGGYASMVALTAGRRVEVGPLVFRPEIGIGSAHFGRKSLVPVTSGRNTSALVRIGTSVQVQTGGLLRPVFDVSWDTHPILPAISLRRAHDLRVGIGLSARLPTPDRSGSSVGDGDGEGADP